jgi:hypothetical protein
LTTLTIYSFICFFLAILKIILGLPPEFLHGGGPNHGGGGYFAGSHPVTTGAPPGLPPPSSTQSSSSYYQQVDDVSAMGMSGSSNLSPTPGGATGGITPSTTPPATSLLGSTSGLPPAVGRTTRLDHNLSTSRTRTEDIEACSRAAAYAASTETEEERR